MDKYEDFVKSTDQLDEESLLFTKVLHGLAGLSAECGEVNAIVQKSLYQDGFKDSMVIEFGEMKKELGDVLWYTTYLANLFGFTLEEIIEENKRKLLNRRGKA